MLSSYNIKRNSREKKQIEVRISDFPQSTLFELSAKQIKISLIKVWLLRCNMGEMDYKTPHVNFLSTLINNTFYQ